MDKKEKERIRKKKNERFIKAFEYVAKRKGMNQTQLAEAIGSKSAYISIYKNGGRPVPEDTMDALIRMSIMMEEGGHGMINKAYLLCESEYMLSANVPDSEISESYERSWNPDYDLIKARREDLFLDKPSSDTKSHSVNDQQEDILEMYARMLRGVDDLRLQLKDEIEQVQRLKADLMSAAETLRQLIIDCEHDRELTVTADTPRIYDVHTVAELTGTDGKKYHIPVNNPQK